MMSQNSGVCASEADYPIGYCRPPIQYQFQPGQSGNPNGRPKRRMNAKGIERHLKQKVKLRFGDKEQKVSLLEANLLAHAFKGAKGDARSAGLIFKYAEKAGLLEDHIVAPAVDHIADTSDGNFQLADKLLENIRVDLLERDECIELSELTEMIEVADDVTALSAEQFGRFKYLVNKARGNDVTPKE